MTQTVHPKYPRVVLMVRRLWSGKKRRHAIDVVVFLIFLLDIAVMVSYGLWGTDLLVEVRQVKTGEYLLHTLTSVNVILAGFYLAARLFGR